MSVGLGVEHRKREGERGRERENARLMRSTRRFVLFACFSISGTARANNNVSITDLLPDTPYSLQIWTVTSDYQLSSYTPFSFTTRQATSAAAESTLPPGSTAGARHKKIACPGC